MIDVKLRGVRILVATGVVWLSISFGKHAFDVMPLKGWSRSRVVKGHVFTIWRMGPFKYTRFYL